MLLNVRVGVALACRSVLGGRGLGPGEGQVPLLHRRAGRLLPAQLPLRPCPAHRGHAPGQGVSVNPSPPQRPGLSQDLDTDTTVRPSPSPRVVPHHFSMTISAEPRALLTSRCPQGSAPEPGWGPPPAAVFPAFPRHC